jgi:hypothetical protein
MPSLYPWGNSPWYALHRRLEWAPLPLWTSMKREKSLAPAGNKITITFPRNIVHFSQVQGIF